jgi:hypothetical protein
MAKTKAHKRYRLKPTKDFPKGEIVPGVTTIVGILDKPALVPWANRMGLQGIDTRKYVDDKADIGTLGHAKILGHLMGAPVDTSDYTANQIDAADNVCLSFFEWQKKHDLKILSAEEALVSEKYRFGGQYDIWGMLDSLSELIDLKTGSGIWEEHYYQVAGGYLLLLEEQGREIHQVRILNVPRSEDENFAEVVLSQKMMQLCKEMFLDCLRIYNRKKEVRKLMKSA